MDPRVFHITSAGSFTPQAPVPWTVYGYVKDMEFPLERFSWPPCLQEMISEMQGLFVGGLLAMLSRKNSGYTASAACMSFRAAQRTWISDEDVNKAKICRFYIKQGVQCGPTILNIGGTSDASSWKEGAFFYRECHDEPQKGAQVREPPLPTVHCIQSIHGGFLVRIPNTCVPKYTEFFQESVPFL